MAIENPKITELLERYRFFEECLLQEVRLSRFGMDLELRFGYIWDDSDPTGARVLREPRLVMIVLEMVREVRVFNDLPAGVLAEPYRANWGLTEVALVRLESASELLAGHRSSATPLYHLAVMWESDQRIDVIFERLIFDSQAHDG